MTNIEKLKEEILMELKKDEFSSDKWLDKKREEAIDLTIKKDVEEFKKKIDKEIQFIREEIVLWENNMDRNGKRWSKERIKGKNYNFDLICYCEIDLLEKLKSSLEKDDKKEIGGNSK